MFSEDFRPVIIKCIVLYIVLLLELRPDTTQPKSAKTVISNLVNNESSAEYNPPNLTNIR